MELKLSRRERGFNGFDEFGESLFLVSVVEYPRKFMNFNFSFNFPRMFLNFNFSFKFARMFMNLSELK